jgi:hypothetical protein
LLLEQTEKVKVITPDPTRLRIKISLVYCNPTNLAPIKTDAFAKNFKEVSMTELNIRCSPNVVS